MNLFEGISKLNAPNLYCSPIPGLDLIKRNFCRFTFPVEQVQTVYRLLARAEPSSLEWLSLAITEGGGEGGAGGEEERSWVYSGGNKRKDETSRVLVYNSYIYPTLGTEQCRPTHPHHQQF